MGNRSFGLYLVSTQIQLNIFLFHHQEKTCVINLTINLSWDKQQYFIREQSIYVTIGERKVFGQAEAIPSNRKNPINTYRNKTFQNSPSPNLETLKSFHDPKKFLNSATIYNDNAIIYFAQNVKYNKIVRYNNKRNLNLRTCLTRQSSKSQ